MLEVIEEFAPEILQLKSDFRLFCLDDGTIGGSEPEVLEDLRFVEQEAASLGVHLNRFKTELICTESAGKQILAAAPDRPGCLHQCRYY